MDEFYQRKLVNEIYDLVDDFLSSGFKADILNAIYKGCYQAMKENIDPRETREEIALGEANDLLNKVKQELEKFNLDRYSE